MDFKYQQETKKIWFSLVGLSLILLALSEGIYKLWVPEIDIPFRLSLFMFLYVNILAYGNIYVWFINGVGKVQLQTFMGIIAALVNIPLSYFFAKYCEMGTAGVILASTICIGYGPILAPIQYRKIMSGKANGVWNK